MLGTDRRPHFSDVWKQIECQIVGVYTATKGFTLVDQMGGLLWSSNYRSFVPCLYNILSQKQANKKPPEICKVFREIFCTISIVIRSVNIKFDEEKIRLCAALLKLKIVHKSASSLEK
jgi:hypothetical protein